VNVKNLKLRKRTVAERYGINVRTLERMVKDGRLPPPNFYIGRSPFWAENDLEAHDRQAATAPRPKMKRTATVQPPTAA
jgi:predicted site-specific integrase-resolvase